MKKLSVVIIFLNLNFLKPFEFSSPIETENGYALIYYNKHQEKMVPDLLNSWDLIYNYAKQKKQNTFFSEWINDIKTDIYIYIQ